MPYELLTLLVTTGPALAGSPAELVKNALSPDGLIETKRVHGGP
jgi:hypothetical protein